MPAASVAVPKFTHLHVHTHYSLLDGACRISPLVKRAKTLGMDSLAITDHGCMFGAIEFYNECKKEGIKPIIGFEAYMAPGHRSERSTPGGNAGEAAYHLLLLAQNLEGYRNLLKLSSLAYKEGFYYKPRVDKEILREFSKGIIATSACLGGEVSQAFMKKDMKAAKVVAETYLDIFGPDRFFIEVQKQGLKEQDDVNPELVSLAKRMGVGLVATNDVHFLGKDDHEPHDVLCCISMGRQVTDPGRLIYPKELYLKSPQEMADACGQFDQALDNTNRIAAMCDLELDFSKRYAPVYRVPPEKLTDLAPPAPMKDDERYLRQLCEEGLTWRYGTRDVDAAVRERLDYEMKVIAMKGFCSYFLIVWDFCNYARDNGIPVGARGSGVGTMVGYLLGLCNVDPIKYGLLFERFMDPSRNEMPDIDIDICQDGRGKVIEYVRNKYGHVAQIITFGTMAAKAACKDVGRVLGVSLAEVDKITKMIPGIPGMTLDKAMSQNPEFAELYKRDANARKLLDLAKKLEGTARNAGMHAAGVIIADQPLDEVVPLYKDSDGNILTQYEGPIAEKCGLLKMDFLGLRTLSIVTRAVELVKQTRGVEIDLEKLDFTDKKVLSLFCKGETKGVFQFESGGMQDLLMKMQPDRLEDLIAANALYRPGPMELIPTYCARKHGKEKVPEVHPIMDAILAETYGIMNYQEQVMQIFNQLGGIELSSAYKLIKAISKKQADVIAKFQPQFIKGAIDKGVSKAKAQEIFDLILKFGGYGFNKSHSTRYAIVAFQTAYMKAYYPVEYMAALLTFEMVSTEKIVEYIDECKRMKMTVLPPDVNVSEKTFTPVVDKKKKQDVIRFGLMAVRGVGEKAVEAILAEREKGGSYNSLFGFCERNDTRQVSRSTLESLVKCGAMNALGGNRAQLLNVLDRAYEMGQRHQEDKRAGQLNMFAAPADTTTAAPATTETLPPLDEFSPQDLLKFEKELLGFYITSHPLTQHAKTGESYATHTTRDALTLGEGAEVLMLGMINRVKKSVTKNGRSAGMPMAMITVEDLEGQMDGVCFAETYAEIVKKYPGIVEVESVCFLRGKIDRRRELPSLMVNEIFPVSEAIAKLTRHIVLRLRGEHASPAAVQSLKPALQTHRGNCDTYLQLVGADKKILMKLGRDHGLRPSEKLVSEVEALLGPDSIELRGATARKPKPTQQQMFDAANDAADDGAPQLNPGEMPPVELADESD